MYCTIAVSLDLKHFTFSKLANRSTQQFIVLWDNKTMGLGCSCGCLTFPVSTDVKARLGDFNAIIRKISLTLLQTAGQHQQYFSPWVDIS